MEFYEYEYDSFSDDEVMEEEILEDSENSIALELMALVTFMINLAAADKGSHFMTVLAMLEKMLSKVEINVIHSEDTVMLFETATEMVKEICLRCSVEDKMAFMVRQKAFVRMLSGPNYQYTSNDDAIIWAHIDEAIEDISARAGLH